MYQCPYLPNRQRHNEIEVDLVNQVGPLLAQQEGIDALLVAAEHECDCSPQFTHATNTQLRQWAEEEENDFITQAQANGLDYERFLIEQESTTQRAPHLPTRRDPLNNSIRAVIASNTRGPTIDECHKIFHEERDLARLTLNEDYGVLSLLPGSWISFMDPNEKQLIFTKFLQDPNQQYQLLGSGLHTTAMPSPGTTNNQIPGKFRFVADEYLEVLNFEKVPGSVRNRGGNHEQFCGAIKYDQSIKSVNVNSDHATKEQNPIIYEDIHAENGMYLWLNNVLVHPATKYSVEKDRGIYPKTGGNEYQDEPLYIVGKLDANGNPQPIFEEQAGPKLYHLEQLLDLQNFLKFENYIIMENVQGGFVANEINLNGEYVTILDPPVAKLRSNELSEAQFKKFQSRNSHIVPYKTAEGVELLYIDDDVRVPDQPHQPAQGRRFDARESLLNSENFQNYIILEEVPQETGAPLYILYTQPNAQGQRTKVLQKPKCRKFTRKQLIAENIDEKDILEVIPQKDLKPGDGLAGPYYVRDYAISRSGVIPHGSTVTVLGKFAGPFDGKPKFISPNARDKNTAPKNAPSLPELDVVLPGGLSHENNTLIHGHRKKIVDDGYLNPYHKVDQEHLSLHPTMGGAGIQNFYLGPNRPIWLNPPMIQARDTVENRIYIAPILRHFLYPYSVRPDLRLYNTIRNQKMVDYIKITLDTDRQDDSGATGGLVNIPFVNRFVPTVRMKFNMWIEAIHVEEIDEDGNIVRDTNGQPLYRYELDENDNKIPVIIHQLQYEQLVFFEFGFGDNGGVTRWPHIQVNTLRRREDMLKYYPKQEKYISDLFNLPALQ